ncbi:hypothetical protein ACEWY4_016256 [Coilia grayii]|uniref:Uncharacterized protein n=1 Tax=Coilia grayii TaxID=363190 RepID=A0ABD1JJU6_9TELE
MEEVCTKEEAREVFENDAKTEAFWAKYRDDNQCTPNPCQNGGTCAVRVVGYNCSCTDFHVGPRCETDTTQCPVDGPYACEHFCRIKSLYYECHCAQGYTINPDGKTCRPHVKYPCGRIPLPANKPTQSHSLPGNEICPQGHCPWQVTLLDRSGESVCSGVILGPRAVLTTATCMSSHTDIKHIQIGKQSPGSEVIKLPLEAVPITHDRYKPGHQGYDLCFLQLNSSLPLGASAMSLCLPEKDFSENILMQDGLEGVIAPERARHFYLSLDDCRNHLNVSFTLSNKMFCMKELKHRANNREEEGGHLTREEQKPPKVQVKPSSTNHIPPRTQETGPGTQGRRPGTDGMHPGTQGIRPGNQGMHSGNQGMRPKTQGMRPKTQGMRPRTQQTVWVTEPDFMEYTVDIELLPDVSKPTVQTATPTAQTKMRVVESPTPEPTAEKVGHTKMEKSGSTTTEKRRGDCGLLSGTPVASVKGKTAFVTGLMLSHDCSQGLVFTKLSRFLPWIKSLLETSTK